VITTLWRTTSEQCEMVDLGIRGARLRFWENGKLLIDERIEDLRDAQRRAEELRVKRQGPGQRPSADARRR
jgi:hypothetical protein